jgi:membrane protein implicated in regulation of membrane protease activity
VPSRFLRRPFARYFLLQTPGWVLAAWVLWLLVGREHLSPWVAWLAWALFVLKDFALYPWLRDAYTVADPDATAALVGRTARRASGSRRRATCGSGASSGAPSWRQAAPPSESGGLVRVREVRGLTLVVEGC